MAIEDVSELEQKEHEDLQQTAEEIALLVLLLMSNGKKGVASLLAQQGELISTNENLTTLLSDVDSLLSEEYDNYTDKTMGIIESTIAALVLSGKNILADEYSLKMKNVKASDIYNKVLSKPMLLESGAITVEEALATVKAGDISKIKNVIKLGFFEGQNTGEIASTIEQILGGRLQNNSTTLAKTIANHVGVTAKTVIYEAQEDIVGYQWVSVMDGKTSDICLERNGKKYYYTDKYKPRPPAHYNCRSTIKAIDGVIR